MRTTLTLLLALALCASGCQSLGGGSDTGIQPQYAQLIDIPHEIGPEGYSYYIQSPYYAYYRDRFDAAGSDGRIKVTIFSKQSKGDADQAKQEIAVDTTATDDDPKPVEQEVLCPICKKKIKVRVRRSRRTPAPDDPQGMVAGQRVYEIYVPHEIPAEGRAYYIQSPYYAAFKDKFDAAGSDGRVKVMIYGKASNKSDDPEKQELAIDDEPTEGQPEPAEKQVLCPVCKMKIKIKVRRARRTPPPGATTDW